MAWMKPFVKVSKILIGIEVVAVGASYLVWRRINRNQEFRKYMHDHHPSILEGFYKTAEFGGIKDARKNDYETWGVTSSSTEGVTSAGVTSSPVSSPSS